MNKMKKFAAIGLAAVMTLGCLTGCSSEQKLDGTQTIATVGDEKISMGTLMSMLRFQQATTYDYYQSMSKMYASQGYSIDVSNMFDRDVSNDESESSDSKDKDKDVEKTGLTVKTSGESLVENVATALTSYAVLEQKASDYGVTLTDSDKESIKKAAKSFVKDSDKKSLFNNGITQDDVEKLLTYYTYYIKVYDVYSEKADVTVTDDETKSMTISYVKFAVSDDKKSDVKKSAEDFLKKCQDDADYLKDMENKAKDIDGASFNSGSMAVNNTEENAYVFTSDQMKKIVETENGAIYGKVVTDSDGNYYVVRMDNNNDKDAAASYSETLKSSKISDAFQKDLKSWKKDVKVTYKSDLLKKIKVTDNVVYTGTKESDSDSTTNTSTSTSDSSTDSSADSSISTETTIETGK